MADTGVITREDLRRAVAAIRHMPVLRSRNVIPLVDEMVRWLRDRSSFHVYDSGSNAADGVRGVFSRFDGREFEVYGKDWCDIVVRAVHKNLDLES